MQFAKPNLPSPEGQPGSGKGAAKNNASHPPHPPSPQSHPPTNPAREGGGRLTLLLSTPPWRATPWAETLPTVLAPLGVQAVHTTSARQAERVIRTTEVHLAVVDLSTPMDDAPRHATSQQGDRAIAYFEEAGTRILELLSRLHQAPPTVVLKSPQQSREEHRQVQHALRCNAFAVVDRTAADLETMLNVMQRALCRFYKDRWPTPPGSQQPPSNFV